MAHGMNDRIAHNLNGFVVRTPAWHGLTEVLAGAPSVQQAKLHPSCSWKAVRMPVGAIGKKETRIAEDYCAMVRSDNGKILSIMGADYNPFQPAQILEWLEPLVDQGSVDLDSVGVLHEGKKFFAVAKIKGTDFEVSKDDSVAWYLVVATSYDGSICNDFYFTQIRAVCWNTLSAGLRGAARKQIAKIKHSRFQLDRMVQLRESLDLVAHEFKQDQESFKTLASKACDKSNLVRYVREVLSPGSADTDKPVRHADRIVELAEKGAGVDSTDQAGSLWGAFNAVTEWATHERGRSGADNRFDVNTFGRGGELMDRALQVGLQFAADAPLRWQGRMAIDNFASAKSELDALLGRPARIGEVPSASI